MGMGKAVQPTVSVSSAGRRSFAAVKGKTATSAVLPVGINYFTSAVANIVPWATCT